MVLRTRVQEAIPIPFAIFGHTATYYLKLSPCVHMKEPLDPASTPLSTSVLSFQRIRNSVFYKDFIVVLMALG
jgi:hypothetical protein